MVEARELLNYISVIHPQLWITLGTSGGPVPAPSVWTSAMPLYEYVCRACGNREEHLQPLGASPPGPCETCGGELRRHYSRVAVRYQGWGFTATDKLLPESRRQQDYRALRERAERIADER